MYLIYAEELWQPLIRRQVIEVLERISAKSSDMHIKLVCYYPWYWILKKSKMISAFKHETTSLHYKISFVPIPYPFPFPAPFLTHIKDVGWRPFSKMNPIMAFVFSFVLLPYLFIFYLRGYKVFHCRSYPISLPTLIFSKIFSQCKFIFDPRSDFPEENITAGTWKKGSLSFKFWKNAERIFLKYSDMTICISERYRDHFAKNEAKFSYKIIPNNVDIEKFKIDFDFRNLYRGKHSLHKKLVFGYLGNMSITGWHRPDIYRRVILKFRELKVPHIFMFIVPTCVNNMLEDDFSKNNISTSEYIIENPKFDEIPKFLSIMDYGLLYLHKTKIALGTKVAEYLVMGLPIIINENIQSAADLVRKHNCGKIINIGLGDLDIAPDKLPSNFFKKKVGIKYIRELGVSLFSLDLVADEYLKIYENLIGMERQVGGY